jgi:hypothetical protein
MLSLLKRVRWTVLLAFYVVVASACRLLHVALPMDSFWRPHNLRRFRPYYVAPHVGFEFRIPPRGAGGKH